MKHECGHEYLSFVFFRGMDGGGDCVATANSIACQHRFRFAFPQLFKIVVLSFRLSLLFRVSREITSEFVTHVHRHNLIRWALNDSYLSFSFFLYFTGDTRLVAEHF